MSLLRLKKSPSSADESLRELYRCLHQFRRFITGAADILTLVARASGIHSHCDVRSIVVSTAMITPQVSASKPYSPLV